MKTKPDSQGFTLIEVLVAIVVLSIGLLAVAGMQTYCIGSINNSNYRSQAVFGYGDILDRMRANTAAARNGDYDLAMGAPPASVGLANTDLIEWRAFLATNLPSGDGEVARDGDIITVTVEWRDSFGLENVTVETRLW